MMSIVRAQKKLWQLIKTNQQISIQESCSPVEMVNPTVPWAWSCMSVALGSYAEARQDSRPI